MWLIEQVPPAIGWSRAPSRLEVRQKSPRIALFVGWLMLFFSPAAKVQVSRCRAGSVLVAACHSPCEAWPAWAASLPTVQGNSAGPQKAASAHPHGLAAASAPGVLGHTTLPPRAFAPSAQRLAGRVWSPVLVQSPQGQCSVLLMLCRRHGPGLRVLRTVTLPGVSGSCPLT